MAEECFRRATKASIDDDRITYLGIAQMWLQAAARLDAGLPIGAPLVPVADQRK
jgi:hypothetical protein